MFARTTLLSLAAMLGLAVLPPTGCVKRTETIKIAPDGTAQLEVVFEGDPKDVYEGDAMLAASGPWTVADQTEVDDEGKETLTRTGALTVMPGHDFPTHYAGDDADLAELALDFSTSLRIEDRPDGTYYHFERVYHSRSWASIDYFRHKFLEDGLKKIEGKDPSEMTDQDRQTVANALVSFEGIKTLVLAEAAAAALDQPLAQEDWLAVHQGIRQVFEEVDTDRIAKLLELEGDEGATEISATVEEIKARLEVAIERVLDDRDPTGATASAFIEQFERQRQRRAITEDLQDENWEVVLQLPGRIIGHNSLNHDPEGGVIQWEFDGDALNDRDQVLLATSVLKHR